jgi:small subunit ribosomal protein S14
MASKSLIAREVKRKKLVDRYAKKRKELKESGQWLELDKLPKNSSKVRLHNRCSITGRPKGYIRYFGVSRNLFRELASYGKLPGVTKASW